MKNLIYFLVLFIPFSIKGQTKTEKDKKPEMSLTTTFPKINHREISKTWKSINAIQKEWVKIEKDKDGYLIYEPCDGNTETIKFEKSHIEINWRLEGEKYNYDKFTRIIGNKSFRLDAYLIKNKKSFEINVRIVDYKNGIVLWEFDGVKWLMTPKENYKSFRTIKNNCETEKKTELEFLPIE